MPRDRRPPRRPWLEHVSRIGRNEYVFGIAARLSMVLFSLVQAVAIARFLGPNLRGELAYDLSVLGVGAVVCSLGLFDAYAYFRRRSSQDRTALGTAYADRFMSTVLLFFLGLFAAAALTASIAYVFNGSSGRILLYLLGIPLWSFSLVVGYVALIESPNRRNLAMLTFTMAEMSIALILLLTAPRMYLLAIGAACFVEALRAIYFTVSGSFRLSLRNADPSHLLELIAFGLVPMLSVLLTTINYRVGILFLGSSASVAGAAVGVYAVGMALAEKVMVISDSMREVLASRLAAGGGAPEVARTIRIGLAVTIVIAASIISIGSPIISFLFGEEFEGAYGITAIALIGTVWMIFFKLIAQYNVMRRKQSTNLVLLLFGVVANLLLNWLLVPAWGIQGSAIATATAYALCACLFLISFRRMTGIPLRQMLVVQRSDLASLRTRPNAN